MPQVMWLLLAVIAGETELDEPSMMIQFYIDQRECEAEGTRKAAKFEAEGGGAVRRNADGSFCVPAPLTIGGPRDAKP